MFYLNVKINAYNGHILDRLNTDNDANKLYQKYKKQQVN